DGRVDAIEDEPVGVDVLLREQDESEDPALLFALDRRDVDLDLGLFDSPRPTHAFAFRRNRDAVATDDFVAARIALRMDGFFRMVSMTLFGSTTRTWVVMARKSLCVNSGNSSD